MSNFRTERVACKLLTMFIFQVTFFGHVYRKNISFEFVVVLVCAMISYQPILFIWLYLHYAHTANNINWYYIPKNIEKNFYTKPLGPIYLYGVEKRGFIFIFLNTYCLKRRLKCSYLIMFSIMFINAK